MYSMLIKTYSPEETEKAGESLGSTLKAGDVVALYGGLGMGKTCFVRGLAKGLGIEAEVSSPTFALVNEYEGKVMTLYHFDMYRVGSFDDLYSTGFFDYLDSGAVMAIEWSENVEEALPDEVIIVKISRGQSENERVIEISGGAVK